jgi:hypothetical protein
LTDLSADERAHGGLANGLIEDDEDLLRTPSPPAEPAETQQSANTPSPARSRKRSRPLGDDDDENEDEHGSPMATAGASAADTDEIIVRRKRVRH